MRSPSRAAWAAVLVAAMMATQAHGFSLAPTVLGARKSTSHATRKVLATGRVLERQPVLVGLRMSDREGEEVRPAVAQKGSKGHETDVVVIGAGLGGLCAGSLLAKYGYRVTVCESHYHPGGCAHGFEIKSKKGGIFKFDAGPSLWAGMNQPSTNPLRQVMDAVGADVEWASYDGWGVFFPDGYFRFNVGPSSMPGGFEDVLRKFGQPGGGLKEWAKVQETIRPLILSCTTFPPMALRADLGAIQTLWNYLPEFLSFGPVAAKINGPFSAVMDDCDVKKDTFLRRWLDYLSFALSGLLADGTICAAVSYTLGDLHRENSMLDYPIGGSGAVCDALVAAIEKRGGRVLLSTHVDQILIEDGKAAGVLLKGGEKIVAKHAVVANAPVWAMPKLLPDEYKKSVLGLPITVNNDGLKKRLTDTPQTDSFMHLHLGIDGSNLKLAEGQEKLDIHYTVINEWEGGIDKAGNMIVISIPTVLDPSLAPEGKHIVHAYTAGNEPYDLFKGLDRKSPEYKALKAERCETLWKAIERVIPDVRSRVEVELTGSPLTHERYLNRPQGTYGPALAAGKAMFPGPGLTGIDGLLCCGDSVFPGIGVPAVAASGITTANTLVSVVQHKRLLAEMKANGKMPDQCMV